ncbi:MAG TPA: adenylate/guanylate cyclase domain-containing protein [Gaiellaceae bacterium]|nr:adenylate/guanylate cyclase domain-containing protein [Gaiellaceae bacterium]
MPLSVPETRYARSGDVSIAYQVFGDGDTPLVWIPGFTQHLELNWEESNRRAWFEGLGRFARVVTLDKRGTGLSDRVEGSPPLEVRMDDIRAVLDAAAVDRAVIAVAGDSGPLGILFAASHAERTLGLILCNASVGAVRKPDMPWLASAEEYASWVDEIARRWSEPDFWDEMFGDSPSLETHEQRLSFARPIRLSVSPGNMAQYLRLNADIDIQHVLPSVRVPTLVLVRSAAGDRVARTARYLADKIPTARLMELPGRDLIPLVFDRESLFAEFESFMEDVRHGVAEEPDRVLATVLFTDIVGSTAKLAELGDRAWRELLAAHHERIRRELSRFRGREVETAGDGFFATFDGPARAIRCACAATESVRDLGVEIRAGLHTGECEIHEGKVGGIAVHIGARVSAEAGPNEVLVSSTVKDLVAGSGIGFVDRGAAALKGVPGEWRLYAVER